MNNIFVLHGAEKQLVEDKKNEIIKKFPTYDLIEFSSENEIQKIQEALQEDSLFGNRSIVVLNNIPLLKQVSQKGAVKKRQEKGITEWDSLYDLLFTYNGENPVILKFDNLLDKKSKKNKDFLQVAQEFTFTALTNTDMVRWTQSYARTLGVSFSPDGLHFFQQLLDTWDNVSLTFIKTEMDRFYLLLPKKGQITAAFLSLAGSDYGSKKIFSFTDSLYNRDYEGLMSLLPFFLSSKRIDSFLAYLEGEISLQLMVAECKMLGMNEKQTGETVNTKGNKVIHPYRIKTAFKRCHTIKVVELEKFLHGMYRLIIDTRRGNMQGHTLEKLCMDFCKK